MFNRLSEFLNPGGRIESPMSLPLYTTAEHNMGSAKFFK